MKITDIFQQGDVSMVEFLVMGYPSVPVEDDGVKLSRPFRVGGRLVGSFANTTHFVAITKITSAGRVLDAIGEPVSESSSGAYSFPSSSLPSPSLPSASLPPPVSLGDDDGDDDDSPVEIVHQPGLSGPGMSGHGKDLSAAELSVMTLQARSRGTFTDLDGRQHLFQDPEAVARARGQKGLFRLVSVDRLYLFLPDQVLSAAKWKVSVFRVGRDNLNAPDTRCGRLPESCGCFSS
jgi:hypothetical protein